jgi:uncharacterized protein YbbC (DUF1343 family)
MFLLGALVASPAVHATEPAAPPVVAAPFPPAAAEAIDRAVLAAISESKLPGAVVAVGRKDSVLFAQVYGYRALTPAREATTMDTVFDLASLTKPLATATSVMVLVDEGRVGLDEPVSRYLPELAVSGKDAITVRQLLTHTSGLAVDTPYGDYASGPDQALRRIAASRMKNAPGQAYSYSDVGFFVLGELVRRVSGQSLDVFSKARLWDPLGMRDTGFLPPAEQRERAALTEPFDGEWMRGVVHDPRARLVGGVAGHAGLFATAQDLAIFAQMLLGEGKHGGVRVLSAAGVRAMTASHDVPGAVRGLGWDVRSSHSSNRGSLLSPRAVGHGGYTGTSLWIDPEKDLFILFLSNRVHPDGKGVVNPLAGRIADIAAAALSPPAVAAPSPSVAALGAVRTGIDVLADEGFARLRGARVAVVTNASGRSRTGARTIDLLRAAPGVTLAAIFAPEHGLGSDRDERIGDERDAATGLPVFSLYGEHFDPSPESLAGIDALVFDIQDAGSRYFTYSSTLKRMMQAAAARGLRFVVLDRPNPIDGVDVAGPVLAPDRASFVNHHALPVRHGMTMGELALLFDADLHLGTKLEIVTMKGWRRASFYDETGLPWTNPSPNLRGVDEALLYDGVGLLEGTNLAVGRGTDTPFEVVGAPFIDGAALAAAMQAAGVRGASFAPTTFTPASSKHRGKACSGVRITVTDRHALDPVGLGLALALAIHRLHPVEWHVAELDKLVADRGVVAAVEAGTPLATIEAMWKDRLAAFRAKREKYLLYNGGSDD